MWSPLQISSLIKHWLAAVLSLWAAPDTGCGSGAEEAGLLSRLPQPPRLQGTNNQPTGVPSVHPSPGRRGGLHFRRKFPSV